MRADNITARAGAAGEAGGRLMKPGGAFGMFFDEGTSRPFLIEDP